MFLELKLRSTRVSCSEDLIYLLYICIFLGDSSIDDNRDVEVMKASDPEGQAALEETRAIILLSQVRLFFFCNVRHKKDGIF